MTGLSIDGFFDLTASADTYTVPANLLTTAPAGVRALEGDDQVLGSSSSDLIYGNSGRDRLRGLNANDTLIGGRDGDNLDGGGGDDVITGNQGEDVLFGDDGNDVLAGGREDDVLLGGAGNDQLSGDLGADLLIGGSGNDTVTLRGDLSGANNLDFLLDFNLNADRLQLSNLAVSDLQLQPASYSLASVLNVIQGSSGVAPPGTSLPPDLTPAAIRQAINLALGVDIDPDGDGNVTGTLLKSAAGEIAFLVGLTPEATSQALATSSISGNVSRFAGNSVESGYYRLG